MRSARRWCAGRGGRNRRRRWRCGVGSCWPAPRARRTRRSPPSSGFGPRRSPSGGPGSSRAGWPGWSTSRGRAHPAETFKLSSDPQFIDKVRDMVGLYLDPPEHALVLCVDEKSQVQALDRSQPVLPMMPGMPQRRTHDYARNGITSLFAALDVASGKVIGSIHRRHRSVEFRKFLVKLDKQVPAELDVHLICDNYATHKTDTIQRWLAAHPRFQLHFVPTSSSWLNLVERWFSELTTKSLQRGVHKSVQALKADIRTWIETWNEDPRPFVWTKTADEILDSLAAYCQRISGAGH